MPLRLVCLDVNQLRLSGLQFKSINSNNKAPIRLIFNLANIHGTIFKVLNFRSAFQ